MPKIMCFAIWKYFNKNLFGTYLPQSFMLNLNCLASVRVTLSAVILGLLRAYASLWVTCLYRCLGCWNLALKHGLGS